MCILRQYNIFRLVNSNVPLNLGLALNLVFETRPLFYKKVSTNTFKFKMCFIRSVFCSAFCCVLFNLFFYAWNRLNARCFHIGRLFNRSTSHANSTDDSVGRLPQLILIVERWLLSLTLALYLWKMWCNFSKCTVYYTDKRTTAALSFSQHRNSCHHKDCWLSWK